METRETKMYHMRVLVLLALQLAIVQGFNWDIVMGIEKRLEFYYNGTLTHTEDIATATNIKSTTYDPVHYRVIFADNNYSTNVSISSFDLSTRKIQHLVTGRTTYYGVPVAYDPVTQLLFWKTGYHNIYSFPLNPASSNKAVDGNLILTTHGRCLDIAVDSCGGYIYWATNHEIERARFDGSEREILIKKYVYFRYSLAIDPQTQKMYWIEYISTPRYQISIESADLNGKDRTTLYVTNNEHYANSLSVSKDFIYWRSENQDKIWQLQKKTRQREEPKLFSISHSAFCWYGCQHIAANYTIKDQTQGNLNCEPLKNLIPNDSVSESTDESVHCSHSTEISEQSRYESTPGYTGERCTVSICQNYCVQGACSVSADGQPECRCKTGFAGERCEVNACHKHCLQGNCSVSTEGKPKCSCYAGYSGERCEVNACHDYCSNNGACSLNEEDEPMCECTEGYDGEKCEVSICKDFCLQGNCSVGTEGQPKCSCNVGYSGERCEFKACHDYCSNNGACSLNEEDEPICECTEGYEGTKCEVSICKDYCLQGNCSVSKEGKPKCSCYAGYSGERCEDNACHQYCSNNGACSLNEEDEPICECAEGYEGEKCEVAICKDYCLQGNCSVGTEGQPKCSCYAGYTGERCEDNACHQYCSNNGACSLDEEDEPICECAEGYEGEKCEVAICKDYCLQGNCSVGTEGQPKCSCNAGFSGERCEFNACHEYCLNNGVCSMNEENEPVCQCSAGYDGERCDVPAVVMKCIQCVSMLRDMLSPDTTPVTLVKEESTCASTVV